MYYLIYYQLCYFFACVIEAILEKYVIDQKKIVIDELIEKNEHKWSAINSAFIGIMFALIPLAIFHKLYIEFFLLLIIMMPLRRIGFDFTLKNLRKRELKNIEGKFFFDKWMRKLFGEKGGYKELFVLLFSILLVNFVYFKFIA